MVYYPGSTERTAFVERRDPKGYALVEVERAVGCTFLDLDPRPMVEVHRERDLSLVTPGALVRLAGVARDRGIENAVIDRGGWVSPWKPEGPEQLGLF